MELSDIDVKQSDTVKGNSNSFYENIEVNAETQDEVKKQVDTNKDEGHYEQLRIENKQRRLHNENKDDQLKKLKCVIFILSAMLIVLYIAVIVLIIFVVITRSPVDGDWTNWSEWTTCDVTCGNGTQIRTRACANPSPSLGGAKCAGESIQSEICMKDTCSDGGWTNWGSWSLCSVTCGGGGTKARSRSCTNPKLSDLGKYCAGDPFQLQHCSLGTCSSTMSAFSVSTPSSYEIIDNVDKLTFSHEIYQNGGNFNLSSGTYKCSVPGTYHFSVTLVKKRASSRVDYVSCSLFKNRQRLIYIKVDPTDDATDNGHAAISQSLVLHLSVSDTVYLSECKSPPSTYMEPWSSFTGFLLYPDI